MVDPQAAAPDQWWTRPDVFKAFGSGQHLAIKKCYYLGGFRGHAETTQGDGTNAIWELEVGPAGLRYHSTQSTYTYPDGETLFTIPWDQVAAIDFDGPEQVVKKFDLNRLGAAAVISPVGALFVMRQKIQSAVVTVRLTSGDEVFFQTHAWLAHNLKAKMAPVLIHYPELPPRQLPPAPNAPSPSQVQPASQPVTEQIRQLAELRDSGILTEAEFQAKKTELLARM